MSKTDNIATVTIGEEIVTVRRRGQSGAEVARILGCEHGPDGRIEKLILDRVVHGYHETALGEWYVTGAVVSVLVRMPEP